jgi:hypothetical protein
MACAEVPHQGRHAKLKLCSSNKQQGMVGSTAQPGVEAWRRCTHKWGLDAL